MKNKLFNLANFLYTQGEQTFAANLIKMAEDPTYLYSFIPSSDKKSVLKHGLLSSEYMTKEPKILKEIMPEEKDRDKFLKKFDPKDMTLKGPSAWFSKPDLNKILKLNKKHLLGKDDYELLRINYSDLKNDIPETEIYGMELVPYENEDYEKLKKKIEHTLSEKEISKLSRLSFEETWEHYLPLDGFYSPNVPHGIIITPDKYIGPEYLEFI